MQLCVNMTHLRYLHLLLADSICTTHPCQNTSCATFWHGLLHWAGLQACTNQPSNSCTCNGCLNQAVVTPC